MLCQVFPGWRVELRPKYDDESATKAAQGLVDWCSSHNGNTLVRKDLDDSLCNDPAGHQAMWSVLQYMRKVAAGTTRKRFDAAIQVLDHAFGTDAWRVEAGIDTFLV